MQSLYLTLHFLNFLAVKHVDIFIAAEVVTLHFTFILGFVTCLKKENIKICIYLKKEKKIKTIIWLMYEEIKVLHLI